MSRYYPPLDTSVVPNPRGYSFLETPIELQGRQAPMQPSIPDLNQSLHAAQIPTPFVGVPLHDTHPAHFAPYADSSDSQSQQTWQSTQAPQPAYRSPPHSPGPLPVKEHTEPRDEPHSNQVVSIMPDSNPLHTPRSPPRTFGIYDHSVNRSEAGALHVNHFPGQIPHPNQEVKGGTWSTGLCECSDIGTCCLGMWCPCILYGRTQYRLSRRSRKEDATNLLGYESCNASCMVMAIFCGCQWLLATIQHTRTRKMYRIPGSIPSDCVRATCCTCCTLIQDEREIDRREKHRATASRDLGINFSSPYLVPEQMRYR